MSPSFEDVNVAASDTRTVLRWNQLLPFGNAVPRIVRAPERKGGDLLALIGRGPDILEPARRHGLAWIRAHHATLDAAIVARAHADGIGVNVWTVDDPAVLATWTSRGVDKLCTNRPATMLAESKGGFRDRQ